MLPYLCTFLEGARTELQSPCIPLRRSIELCFAAARPTWDSRKTSIYVFSCQPIATSQSHENTPRPRTSVLVGSGVQLHVASLVAEAYAMLVEYLC
eukprot:2480919-Amphidinium_carterae.1